MFHRCRESDECFRATELLKLIDEMIEILRITENTLDKHRIITGYTGTFNDIRDALDERIKILLVLWIHFKIKERLNGIAECAIANHWLVSTDNTGLFHSMNS